ncbi:MFS-type transporter SLC18B1-like [Amphibalanus amphitrite]|uniref:MFS-type transporter SLC18B1-like n=1 Tax=Amphibalanus amphitrite TaxID=1232801 RepID=UPI001C90184C|nr:MFS-type transporter SLC18B1-like [Amphibalanus amphitrite]
MDGSLIAIMIPFFPVEAASRGVSQAAISGVFSCYAVAKMMLSPLVGRLAPKIGISRLYNIGLALAGATTLLFGLLNRIEDTQTFMGAAFAVRLVEAVGSAAISTCGYTIAGSEFGSRVTTAVAVIGSSLTLGVALTPALWGGLYAVGGFGTPFFTLGALMLLTSAALIRLIPDIESTHCQQAPFATSLLKFLGAVDNWLCLATVFVFSAVINTVEATLAVYADRVLGVPPTLVGLFFLVSSTITMLDASVASGLDDSLATRAFVSSLFHVVFSLGYAFFIRVFVPGTHLTQLVDGDSWLPVTATPGCLLPGRPGGSIMLARPFRG